jgi:hypothetical protein
MLLFIFFIPIFKELLRSKEISPKKREANKELPGMGQGNKVAMQFLISYLWVL